MITTVLKNRLPAIQAEMEAKVEVAVRAFAPVVVADAKSRVPDAPPTGEGLVEAIHADSIPGGFTVTAGDEHVFYGHMIENGTTKMPPRPFLVPALEAAQEAIVAGTSKALRSL